MTTVATRGRPPTKPNRRHEADRGSSHEPPATNSHCSRWSPAALHASRWVFAHKNAPKILASLLETLKNTNTTLVGCLLDGKHLWSLVGGQRATATRTACRTGETLPQNVPPLWGPSWDTVPWRSPRSYPPPSHLGHFVGTFGGSGSRDQVRWRSPMSWPFRAQEAKQLKPCMYVCVLRCSLMDPKLVQRNTHFSLKCFLHQPQSKTLSRADLLHLPALFAGLLHRAH